MQYTRFSSQGLGAVLERSGHAVAYYSRSLSIAEQNYNVIEQECLAIVESLKRFRHYLIGRKFQILTDHKPLEWLANQKSIGRLWRWAVTIQEYEFTIKHRKDQENSNADALSRLYNPTSIEEDIDYTVDSLQAESDRRVTNCAEWDLEHSAVTELTELPNLVEVNLES